MKIAVIDHIGNPGGGSRVTRALLPAMKKVNSDLKITFFGNPHSIKREQLDLIAKPYDIQMRGLNSVKLSGKDLFDIRGSRHVVNLIQRKFTRSIGSLSYYLSGAVELELQTIVKGFDIAFFTWPFHLKCPELSCPMAGIFHDFNFKYFFSGPTMAPWVLEFLNQEMPIWLSKTTPIVSTEFMRKELEKFYPEFGHKTRVVPVAPTSTVSQITEERAREIVRRLKVNKPYILCPANICTHKNIGSLISAMSLLREKRYDLQLIFVGSGTEIINGRASLYGLEIDRAPQDVHGFGYVSNEEIDSLIQCAEVVVNPSLYEGGNVPAFDAWARGVPVAMSHIPTFIEHISAHGVRAELFDPRSPQDIAEKLGRILSDPKKANEDARLSQQAMSQFTWEKTAQGYLDIFEEIL